MNEVPSQFSRFIAPKPKCEIVTLDKPLVDWLLSINTDNRKVKRAVVRRYAEEIRKGEWEATSQGIGVSRDGVLLDGQHRLLALRECDYPPTDSVLVYGLRKEAQYKVDVNAKRSAADALALALHIQSDNMISGGVRIVACIEDGRFDLGGSYSTVELAERYERNATAWESVSLPKKKPGFDAPFAAACVYAVTVGVRVRVVQEFIDGCRTGANLPPGSPILRLLSAFDERKRGHQPEKFGMVARALAAYAEGRSLGQLRKADAKTGSDLLKAAAARTDEIALPETPEGVPLGATVTR